jgi:hypothetical protein
VRDRLPIVAGWLIAGHAVAAGLFWALLQVPESSAVMLGVSVIVAALVIATLVWVLGGAAAAWRPDVPPARAALRGFVHAPAVVLGALVFALAWWLTREATVWHTAYAGQIDAWIIARTGKSDTARLHAGIFWALWFLRWGLGLTIALSLVAWVVRDGPRAAIGPRWLASALNPLRWLAVTALVGLGIALPWHFAYWRPARLPIDAEPWFVGAKLAAMLIAAAVAAALTLRVVTPPNRQA